MFNEDELAVVVNCKAGRCLGGSAENLAHLFDAAGLGAKIYWIEPQELLDVLRQLKASGVKTIIVGGGDGTMNTAANCLVGTDIALGVLPLGTFNNFARDLGMPLRPEQAIHALVEGSPQAIDVGEMNGRVFINNASLGIYPHIVRRREAYQNRLGWRKMHAMGYALWGIFWRLPVIKIWMEVNGERRFLKVPFIFLGNNRYDAQLFSYLRRESLTEGHLSVFYTPQLTRLALVKIVFKALFLRLREIVELERLWVVEAKIETRKKRLKVALDGESLPVETPLVFRSRPLSLRVIMPKSPQ